MANEVKENVLLNELIEEYGERVIALAQHLNLDLEINEADFELDPDEEFETEEEKEERLQELKEEKEEAIQDIKNELENITEGYKEGIYNYYNEEYLVLTDDEADIAWDDELENYIDECIIPELERAEDNIGIKVSYYFDRDAWKRDAQFDGRGHSLSLYDGTEYEEKVNGTWYFIYRQN